MTDHKALIQISFSMYGQKKETEMYINYSADLCRGVDIRVIEWFEEALAEFESIYDSQIRSAEIATMGKEQYMKQCRIKDLESELEELKRD